MNVFPTHIVGAAGVTINDSGEILLVKHHKLGWVFVLFLFWSSTFYFWSGFIYSIYIFDDR